MRAAGSAVRKETNKNQEVVVPPPTANIKLEKGSYAINKSSSGKW